MRPSARILGIAGVREKRSAAIPLDVLVDAQAVAAGWPKPERECRFHPERRWRADFWWNAQPDSAVALEIEGGVFQRRNGGKFAGWHQSAQRMLGDMEKYNTMAAMGIRLIRLTPQQVRRGELQTWLEKMR